MGDFNCNGNISKEEVAALVTFDKAYCANDKSCVVAIATEQRLDRILDVYVNGGRYQLVSVGNVMDWCKSHKCGGGEGVGCFVSLAATTAAFIWPPAGAAARVVVFGLSFASDVLSC